MERVRYAVCALVLISPLVLTRHDDDFAFDNSDEFQVELTSNHSEIEKNGLKRLWGVPDTTAYVGHLFRMEIPKEAFSGDVQAYKVRNGDGSHIPGWLAVDSRHGLISGVPQPKDVGSHHFVVTAHGKTAGLSATDAFSVEVKKADAKAHSKYGVCVGGQNRLVLIILVDSAFSSISPRHRIRALMELANFMALDGDEFSIEPYKAELYRDQVVLMSGPGTTQRRKSESTTAIYFNVGCGDKLWSRHKVLVAGLREQSRDGTLAQVLRLPILGWRLLSVKPLPRLKRQLPIQTEGSGTYNYDDEDDDVNYYSGDGDDDDEDDDDDYYSRVDSAPSTFDEGDKVNIEPLTESATVPFSISPRIFSDIFANTTEPETQTVIIRASNEVPTTPSELPPTVATSPEPAPSTTESTSTSSSTSTTIATSVTSPSTTPATTPITSPSPPPPPPTTPFVETTVTEVTEQETMMTTDRSSTIIGRTTETVTIPMPINQPPSLGHHMKKLAITAGKAFRYIIPAGLFTDAEDGTNLTFRMYEADNTPLNKDSWIQFIPSEREVYGLPLDAHVSRWNFMVEAKDSKGAIARGPLDITVQQYRSARTINHQFIMQFKLNKEFDHSIDWQIRALEGIVNLFRDTDMEHLTVLNATQEGELCEFVWTNDTLPKDPACPMESINRLMKIMESETEQGSPSAALTAAFRPELVPKRVRWRGVGACTGVGSPPPPTRAPDTYPPVTRNQVDLLRATVGHLLVYRVPEDTFFDPEDGGTRNLRLRLRGSDRGPLPAAHWLHFDDNNQEFYGLPGPGDLGSTQYQLVAEDSSKKSAYDSLIVEVSKPPPYKPTVEFQMTVEYPFATLAYSASAKRKLVEKLALLFGQTDTSSIRIQNITDSPTTIIWYNTSLPTDRCPEKEIEEVRKMIIVDERTLRDNVDQIFDKDFKVMSIRLILLGLCAEQGTKTSKTHVSIQGTNSNLQNKAGTASDGGYTEYLVTFVIPAVVIVCMILVASIIACVLYKRRRTGKMSVGDEEERQAFRSKGIPVIFQDELEEQAGTEPLHKSPVIMREEKPPLLPPAPDYRNSAPYRPPPPVAPATTPPRPKATPTYRKPPPYVPP